MRILQDYCINMILWWSNVVGVIEVAKWQSGEEVEK